LHNQAADTNAISVGAVADIAAADIAAADIAAETSTAAHGYLQTNPSAPTRQSNSWHHVVASRTPDYSEVQT
jgi:hypothetical protein